jgi:hypothetical protein
VGVQYLCKVEAIWTRWILRKLSLPPALITGREDDRECLAQNYSSNVPKR